MNHFCFRESSFHPCRQSGCFRAGADRAVHQSEGTTTCALKTKNELDVIFASFKASVVFFSSFPQGHSLSDGLDDVQRAEMKAYMELVNNMLLTAEVQGSTHTQLWFRHVYDLSRVYAFHWTSCCLFFLAVHSVVWWENGHGGTITNTYTYKCYTSRWSLLEC